MNTLDGTEVHDDMRLAPALPAGPSFQRQLLGLILNEQKLLLRLTGMALFGGVASLSIPWLSRLAVDDALPKSSPRLLVALSLCAVFVYAHQAWASWIESSTAIALQARVEKSALSGLVGALLRSSYDQLRQRDSGWTSQTLGAARGACHSYIEMFASLVTQAIFGACHLLLLLNLSPQLVGVVVVVSCLLTAVSWALARWETKYVRLALDCASAERQLLHVLTSRLASLRGLFGTERLGASWNGHLNISGRASVKAARAATLRGLAGEVIGQALNLGIMIWAVYRCFRAELQIGEMMMLLSVSSSLAFSIIASGGALVALQAMKPQFERINQLLEGPRAMPAANNPVQMSETVALDGVWHRYSEAGRWVVSNYCLQVERGELLRLTSPSGTGKTTILRLLAGLMAPTRGAVSVFGIDASRAGNLVLYVPQHATLFEASIAENLTLLSGASLDHVMSIAPLTGLTRLLKDFPMGIETAVSAHGRNLSSGQRQLIALTAAFASSRPVLLLDEATSQLDAETRRLCRWDLLLKGRTVILVEHG